MIPPVVKKLILISLALMMLFLAASGVLEQVIGRVTMIDKVYEEDPEIRVFRIIFLIRTAIPTIAIKIIE